jgi:putative tryptophan/tyrosine transport system substrate-binding protein
MNRRTFLSALSGSLLAVPLAAEAQQAGKVYRLGVLSTTGAEQENVLSSLEKAWEAGAKELNLQFRWMYLQSPDDIDKTFTTILQEGFGALSVTYVPVTWINRRQIIDLAARHRLPAIYQHRNYVADGGLMAYGEDEREVPRRLAVYVDRILKGAKPADLPIQQPTTFEFVINLKTAKALGLTIPPSLLQRADQVIE